MQQFLTTAEFNAIVRRADITTRKWRRNGRGPRWTKVEGRIMYYAPEVAAWLKAQPVGGDAASLKPEDTGQRGCVLAPSVGERK